MDLWILYSDSFDNNIENPATRMLNEANKFNIKAELLFYPYFKIEDDFLYYKDNLVLEYPKIVFMRGQAHELVSFLEKKGVKSINSSYTIKACRDKLITHQIVGSLGIPQIKTLKASDYSFIEAKNALGLPFILKYRSGCQGIGIYIINNLDEYNNITKDLNLEDYLLQEYIKESYGKDLRIYICGNEAIGAVKRENDNDFKSNLAQGGLSYHYELTEELIKNSLLICKELKGDIISVDYVFSKNGLLFCEANTNAGFASFNYLGYPMRQIFMKYIKSLLELH